MCLGLAGRDASVGLAHDVQLVLQGGPLRLAPAPRVLRVLHGALIV